MQLEKIGHKQYHRTNTQNKDTYLKVFTWKENKQKTDEISQKTLHPIKLHAQVYA